MSIVELIRHYVDSGTRKHNNLEILTNGCVVIFDGRIYDHFSWKNDFYKMMAHTLTRVEKF